MVCKAEISAGIRAFCSFWSFCNVAHYVLHNQSTHSQCTHLQFITSNAVKQSGTFGTFQELKELCSIIIIWHHHKVEALWETL